MYFMPLSFDTQYEYHIKTKTLIEMSNASNIHVSIVSVYGNI